MGPGLAQSDLLHSLSPAELMSIVPRIGPTGVEICMKLSDGKVIQKNDPLTERSVRQAAKKKECTVAEAARKVKVLKLYETRGKSIEHCLDNMY